MFSTLFGEGVTLFEMKRPLNILYHPSAMIIDLFTSLLNKYELGMMTKFMDASRMIIGTTKLTSESGFEEWILIKTPTKPVINSKNQDKTVIWMLTLFVLRLFLFDSSDNASLKNLSFSSLKSTKDYPFIAFVV